MGIRHQTWAASKLAVAGLPRRPAAAAAAALSILLVVLVLCGFLAVGNGYQTVLRGAGSEDVGIVLREGATTAQGSVLSPEQVALVTGAPGIARFSGRPAISPEMTVQVSVNRGARESAANLPIRGINPESRFLLRGIALVNGRAPMPGTNEMIVGVAAQREFPGLALGSEVQLASTNWKVVGSFTSGGSVYESEARADLHVIQPLFRRGSLVQSVRLRLDGASGLTRLQEYLKSNPQAALSAQSEQGYFRHLAATSGTFIQRLGWPLAMLMAVGAMAGAGNAMFGSVEDRSGEILTLRTLGFGRTAIFLGVLAEALLVALAGGVVGIALSYLIFDGLSTSTAGRAFGQVMFQMRVGPGQIAASLLLAILVGLVGGMAPAVKAARMPLALAGRE